MVVVDKENFMGGTGIAHFEHVMMQMRCMV